VTKLLRGSDVAIRFHLDEHVDDEVAARLRKVNIDVTTTAEIKLKGAEDHEQLAHAHSAGRVIVTNDLDYLVLNAKGIPHCGIAHYPKNDASPKQIATMLIALHGVYDSEDMRNRVEFI